MENHHNYFYRHFQKQTVSSPEANYIPSEPTEIFHGIGDFPALASLHQQTTDRNLRNALRRNDRFSERHPGLSIDRL